MENNTREEKNEQTTREQFETELAAINLLQQVGVTFCVPLKREEIAAITAKKSFLSKMLRKRPKLVLPSEAKVNMRKMPNPENPAEQIDYYEAEISIRPLCLSTIDAIRAKRLELELKDPEVKEHFDSTDVNDTYLLRYTKEVCEVLAIATLNVDDVRKYHVEICQWAEFYRTHLTNQRYMKLVQVIMMMMDASSFRASTRLILGLGTTAPREANRVVKPQSKD
ncbi:MAG: hypothetical protein IJR84_09180 [Bacteroidaceae bacterium]|nr:hypothetical protein [Bacteroidaceae bacterium]